MGKAEKEPKAPKKEKKPKPPKKVKEKKTKAKKMPELDEAAEKPTPAEVVPIGKVAAMVFGCIAFTAVFFGAGVFAGLSLIKIPPNVENEDATTNTSEFESASSNTYSYGAPHELVDGPTPGAPNYSWLSIINSQKTGAVLGANTEVDETAAHSESAAEASVNVTSSAGNSSVSAQTPRPRPASSNTARPSGTASQAPSSQLASAETNPPSKPRAPLPKEYADYLEGYANSFEQTSQLLTDYSSNSDISALKQLYESANNNANELFNNAVRAEEEGSPDSASQSMYELSSAYSILADGINYAATVLENGELFDTELIEMTNESAREKFESALGAVNN